MADWKKLASNNWLDLTLSGVCVVSDIASGKGVVKSIGSGVLEYAKWDLIGGIVGGPAMFANFALQIGGLAGNIALEHGRGNASSMSRNSSSPGIIGGRGFFDNQNAYTMRQRGLNAIGGHQGMVNNALGSEARRRAANIRY